MSASSKSLPPIHPFVPQTPDALPVELQRLDEGHVLHRMGLHGHTFFELIYVEEAGGAHRVAGKMYPTEPGALFVIPPGECHDCTTLGVARGWVLLFTPEALDGAGAPSRAFVPHWPTASLLFHPFSRRASLMPASVPERDRARWSERFRTLAQELDERPRGYRYGVQAHLSLMLLDVLRLAGSEAEFQGEEAREPIIQAAFDFIERSYSRPISARDVARAVGRSTAHLTTIMRQNTGLTAGDWVTERRMAEARRLLVSTELGIGAIADRTGYSDTGALARAFRRIHQLTPASWRQAHRGQPPYI